jgi:biopolymer transport protein ExbD/biopolymer transport protein TolR
MSSDSARRMARLRALRQVFADDEHEQPLPSVKSDINVTPLVDVVLVLLIIFMVVTPMIASGVAVDLPKTAHHLRKPDDGKDIIVSVTQDKRYYVGTTRVNRVEDLSAAIKNERRRFPEKTIFVKGDARAPFGTVREAMQVLQASDISDVVLGTEELQKLGGGS